MIGARPKPGRHLGLTADDLRDKPYAKHWRPAMAPLPEHARAAVAHGPVAPPLLPPLASARALFAPHGDLVEDGYAIAPDGALHIAIRTELPGVSPAMIDWWFGWHSDEPERYKLWHPRAHVCAEWQSPARPGLRGRARYLGRTSCVDEYVGASLGRYAIHFVEPARLGLAHPSLDDPREATVIGARVGLADWPLDAGYLVHHVRRTPSGAEMRSRFWIGGPYAAARAGGPAGGALVAFARPFVKPTHDDGRDLLVHCSQEMSHLASFLPSLFAELGHE